MAKKNLKKVLNWSPWRGMVMTMMKNEQEKLWLSGEIARAFGVSRTAVNNWARSGRLPSVQPAGPHGTRFYRHQDVLRLFQTQPKPEENENANQE